MRCLVADIGVVQQVSAGVIKSRSFSSVGGIKDKQKQENTPASESRKCHNRDMSLDELRHSNRNIILTIASHHGARNVRVFGSVAKGEAAPLSDLDLLVDLEPGRSLMDLGGLLMDLQAQLGVRIDVATERMLRPEIRERVMAEAILL